MICPYCKHEEDKYGGIDGSNINGFFRLSDSAERMVYGNRQVVSVYGCPSCRKLFLREE